MDLLQIKAFGLNRMDISQREGKYPPPAGSSTILGVEFSGTITEVSSDVSDWKVDDEVLGLTGGVSVKTDRRSGDKWLTGTCAHKIREPMRNI